MRAKSAADILLHPQRLAIARALSQHELTTKQLAELLSDIPQATLYRHLSQLLEAGFVEIVGERKVRGTTERTYKLGESAILTADALRAATPEDHFRYFATYVAGLLDQFGGYLRRPEIDLHADGVSYRELVLNLTDDEFTEMLTELRSVLAARLANERTGERRPRLISTITMPVASPGVE